MAFILLPRSLGPVVQREDRQTPRSSRQASVRDKVLKQGTLYTASNIRQAGIKRTELEKPECISQDAQWGDEDEQFELGLEKWGVDVEDLKKPAGL